MNLKRGDILTPEPSNYDPNWTYARGLESKNWYPLVNKGIYIFISNYTELEQIIVLTPEGVVATVHSYPFKKV